LTNWRKLVACGDYRGLKRLLLQKNLDSLRRSWKRLEPMEKTVIFKLMEPRIAIDFYRELSFPEKYCLFSAFDQGSIAPVLEGLPPRRRSLFHRLPKTYYDDMLRLMQSQSVL